jgi:hypothetical protein
MRIFERTGRFFRPRLGRQNLVSLLPLVLLFAAWPQNLSAQQDEQDPAQAAPRQRHVQQTPGQLQQLVAPIALYPDSLVAQRRRRRFPSKSSRPTPGCKRILI